jgi:hypothetical protein
MVDEHVRSSSDVAQVRDEYVLFQATNPEATSKIPTSSTKNVHIKGKSAEGGPAGGYIPIDQSLSKKVNNPSPALLAEYKTQQGVLDHFNAEVKKCINEGWAISVDVKVKSPPPDTVAVLGDPKTGRPIVADYDMLSVGRKGDPGQVTLDKEKGAVTAKDEQLIDDLNQAMDRTNDPVVHHGPANQAPVNPGINYPVTALEPNGNIVSIEKGPAGDPDKNLKDYFNKVNRQGYRMEPHPKWGWQKVGEGKWQ